MGARASHLPMFFAAFTIYSASCQGGFSAGALNRVDMVVDTFVAVLDEPVRCSLVSRLANILPLSDSLNEVCSLWVAYPAVEQNMAESAAQVGFSDAPVVDDVSILGYDFLDDSVDPASPHFGYSTTAGPSSPAELPDEADKVISVGSSSLTSFLARSPLVCSVAPQRLLNTLPDYDSWEARRAILRGCRTSELLNRSSPFRDHSGRIRRRSSGGSKTNPTCKSQSRPDRGGSYSSAPLVSRDRTVASASSRKETAAAPLPN